MINRLQQKEMPVVGRKGVQWKHKGSKNIKQEKERELGTNFIP